MMEMLQGFPDNVLAVKASGDVTKQDYIEVLIPAANAAFHRHAKLRVYFETDADFKGMDAGAMWEDITYSIGHMTQWDRIAVVTSVDWIKYVVNLFGFFMLCPVKVFPPSETARARVWISET